MGGRGVPGRYGGYETLFEELGARLVKRGVEVTAYCRTRHTPTELSEYRGMKLVVLPTIHRKFLETPVHTLLACLHASFRHYDAVLLVNAANAMFVPLLRLTGSPVALHVDGIESRRAKWNWFGRAVYAISERLAPLVSNEIIADAEEIQRHYRERLGADSVLIRYGVEPRPVPPGATLAEVGVESGRYFLYVARFEPENNPHRVVEAYEQVETNIPLVMVGGAPYADRYIRSFTEKAGDRLRFPGPIYGDGYRELLSNALASIHAADVGGTHPALVESMGYGNCIIINDIPGHRETAGPAALYFRASQPETLTAQLRRVLDNPEEAASLGRSAASRAAEEFDWGRVTDQYLDLFRQLAGNQSSPTA